MAQSTHQPETPRVASEALANLGHGADRRIFLRALRTGLWTWPAFTVLDAYMCFVAYPGAPLGQFVIYRVLIELLFLAIYRAGIRETTSVGVLFRWVSVSFSATA